MFCPRFRKAEFVLYKEVPLLLTSGLQGSSQAEPCLHWEALQPDRKVDRFPGPGKPRTVEAKLFFGMEVTRGSSWSQPAGRRAVGGGRWAPGVRARL